MSKRNGQGRYETCMCEFHNFADRKEHRLLRVALDRTMRKNRTHSQDCRCSGYIIRYADGTALSYADCEKIHELMYLFA